ncbi:MAG: hypothetical protein AB9900_07410 [Humidesulfovibrio sp.]
MEEEFVNACTALRKLSEAIHDLIKNAVKEEEQSAKSKAVHGDRTDFNTKYDKIENAYVESSPLFGLVLNNGDLSYMARKLASDIESAPEGYFTDVSKGFAKDIPPRVNIFIENIVPCFFDNTKRDMAYFTYISTLQHYRMVLGLNNVSEADLKHFVEVRDKVSTSEVEIGKMVSNVKGFESDAKTIANDLPSLKEKAELIIKKAEDALELETTRGLAGAFHARSKELETSIDSLKMILLCALACGVFCTLVIYILPIFYEKLRQSYGDLFDFHYVSFVAVGAAVWVAWLATKQIGQRFRLAEDYAFKATIAKIYEGYKAEAANVDEKSKSRLFGILLTRLDEHPLRFVEQTSHGSPWHEFASKFFPKASAKATDWQGFFVQAIAKAICESENAKDAKKVKDNLPED